MVVNKEQLHDDQCLKVMILIWTLTGFTFIVVLARLYTSQLVARNIWIEDYIFACSAILILIHSGITTAALRLSFGNQSSQPGLETSGMHVVLNQIGFSFGILCSIVPRFGVPAMLGRVLQLGHLQKAILWMLASTAAVLSVVRIPILFTMCGGPISLLEGGVACRTNVILDHYSLFTDAFTGVVDLFFAFSPIPTVWKLHMALRKRMYVCAAFGLVAINCPIAVVKWTQLKGVAETYESTNFIMWASFSANIYVLSYCLPTLKPLLDKAFGRRTTTLSPHGPTNLHTSSYRLSQARASHEYAISNAESQGSSLTIKPLVKLGR